MADNEGGDASMDVDDEAKEGDNEEDYSEVLQDPAFIQVNIFHWIRSTIRLQFASIFSKTNSFKH